jgi:rhamnogalacturonan hydrolase
MVIVQNANDFEMYSSTSAGGFQGNGYQCRNAGFVCVCSNIPNH